jgi:outer membrane protein assembly factor BamB
MTDPWKERTMRCRRLWILATLTALVLPLLTTTVARAATPNVGASATAAARTVTAVKGDWPQDRHDPAHTSFNRDERQISPNNVGRLRVAWQQPGLISTPLETLEGDVGTPIVAGGTAFVPKSNFDAGVGALAAYDARTGRPKWQVRTACVVGQALHAGLLLVGQVGCRPSSFSSDLMALDPATGNQLWRISDREQTSAPTAADGVVYVSSANEDVITPLTHEVRAVDARTGQIKWTVETSQRSGQPTAVAGRILFCSGSTLSAVAAANGSPRWHAVLADDQCGDAVPTVSGGIVYLQTASEGIAGDGVCHLHAFRLQDGSSLWQRVAACNGDVAVAHGRVFTSAADFTLLALDATTGARAWISADRLNAGGTPTVANHVLYAQTTEGFAAYRVSDGARRLLVPLRGLGQPVVAHGFVYVGKVTTSSEGSVLQALHK